MMYNAAIGYERPGGGKSPQRACGWCKARGRCVPPSQPGAAVNSRRIASVMGFREAAHAHALQAGWYREAFSLRPCMIIMWTKRNCQQICSLSCKGFASMGRPKGFPIALWKPSGANSLWYLLIDSAFVPAQIQGRRLFRPKTTGKGEKYHEGQESCFQAL